MPKGSTYCASCGAENTAAARFCVQCGNALVSKAAPQEKNVCPSCGAKLAPAAHFCAKCGSALAAPSAGLRKPTPAPRRSPAADLRSANAFLEAVPLWVWVGLLGLALVLSYFTFSGNRKPAPAAAEAVAPTASVAENELSAATPVAATPTNTSMAPAPGWQQAFVDELSLWLPGEFFVATSVQELHELAAALRDNGQPWEADFIEGISSIDDMEIIGTIGWFEQGVIHLYAAPPSDHSTHVDNVTISHDPVTERPLEDVMTSIQEMRGDFIDVFEDIDFDIPGHQTYAARIVFYGIEDDPDFFSYTYVIVRGDEIWEISIGTDFLGWDFDEEDLQRIIDSVEFN